MVGYLVYHRCLQLQKYSNDVSHSKVKGQPHCNVIIFFLKISFLCITQQSKSRKRDSKKIYIFLARVQQHPYLVAAMAMFNQNQLCWPHIVCFNKVATQYIVLLHILSCIHAMKSSVPISG